MQDPNEALLKSVSPRVREFDDFFAKQKARRALGATKLGPSMPPGTPTASVPISAPAPTHVNRRAEASKGVIDAVDDYMESIGGWKNSRTLMPDDDGKLISPRAKIIRNPERAAMVLEQIGWNNPDWNGVAGDKNNPFFRRVEDAAKAYQQVIGAPAEQELRGGLASRDQALTAKKQAGLQAQLKAAESENPVSLRQSQDLATKVSGIKQSIIPGAPKPPMSANEQLLKQKPDFMVGPELKVPPAENKELPGQANLRELIDDDLFNTGTKGPRTFAEVALDVGKDIGLDPDETQRAMLVSQRTDPQRYNQTIGAPADSSKSDDISRFLLLALAFGAQKALQIVMQERRDRRNDAREIARADRDEERLTLDRERGDRDERRVTLAENEATARERRWGETFNQREKLANMRSKIQLLTASTASQDRNKALRLRPFLAKLDSLSEQAKSQMMSPDAFLANPAVAQTLTQMETILNE